MRTATHERPYTHAHAPTLLQLRDRRSPKAPIFGKGRDSLVQYTISGLIMTKDALSVFCATSGWKVSSQS